MKGKILLNDTMNYTTTLYGISDFRVAIHNQLYITLVSNRKKKKEDYIRRLSHPFTDTRVRSVKRINLVLQCSACEKMDKVEEAIVSMASLFPWASCLFLR